MLKNSARNSTASLSMIVVRLNTAKSKLTTPCCRSEASTRGSLPKVQGLFGILTEPLFPLGAVKQAVLNHSLTLATALPDTFLSHPGM